MSTPRTKRLHERRPNGADHPPQPRAQVVEDARSLLAEYDAEIAQILGVETGSTDRKTGVELNLARRVRTVSEGLSFESDGGHKDSVIPGKENVIERKPVGVVGVITPWNFPLHLSMRVVVCR